MTAESPSPPIGLLLSGGLDSSILLGHLLATGRRVQPFYVRSHLLWEGEELAAVGRFLRAIASPGLEELVVLDLPLEDLYDGHWSLTGRGVPDFASPDTAVYLPGRNALLLIKAALWCRLARHRGVGPGRAGGQSLCRRHAGVLRRIRLRAPAGRRRADPLPSALRPTGKAASDGVGPRPAPGIDLLLHRADRRPALRPLQQVRRADRRRSP